MERGVEVHTWLMVYSNYSVDEYQLRNPNIRGMTYQVYADLLTSAPDMTLN